MLPRFWLPAGVVAGAALACGGSPTVSDATEATRATDAGVTFVADAGAGVDAAPNTDLADSFDIPLRGITTEQLNQFFDGDRLFELTLRPFDGLGPLYTRASCGACHSGGVRGPGLVRRMAVMLVDGITVAPDQATLLPYGSTVRALLEAGAKTPIEPPTDPSVRVSVRLGPSILGRGYLEAVADREILRVESAQALREDGIHGRANRVIYASEANPDTRFNAHAKGDSVIGRFGLKARIATLDEFVADALQGDMGITSPLRPTETVNPDGLTDDLKPGADVTADSVNGRATYMRLTAIPERRAATPEGLAAFDSALCSVCHVPSLATRADYPLAPLAGIAAPVFTDFLLHDMGEALADGIVEGGAGSRDWRTAPLLGLRFAKTYLHDGRASSIAEAIELHGTPGSEAAPSTALYHALSASSRDALVAYVLSL